MPLPNGGPPWHGLDAETLRFLEVHPARALAVPGRAWQDLGDSVMLYSAREKEPFLNRLTAVRWPDDPVAFDARLRQATERFEALDRRPYLWVIPGLSTPSDLVARLAANGFTDQGGGHDMVLVEDPRETPELPLPEGVVLERWHGSAASEIPPRASAIARVVVESFGIPAPRHANLVAEIGLTLAQPYFHSCLLSIDGEPIATGQRYTFDGASYLSSIGTRPAWRGRGLGTFVTQALARDSVADGVDLVYLGVYAENVRAIHLYERHGFAVLGPRSADMLLDGPAAT